jgi:hypothetical protein
VGDTCKPKVCRFKPGQSNGFLRAVEICSMPSFRGEVKSLAKNHFQFIIPFACSSHLLPDDLAGKIVKESRWTNWKVTVDVIPPWFSVLIDHLGDEQ